MPLLYILAALALLFVLPRSRSRPAEKASARERALKIRLTLFSGVLGVLFLLAYAVTPYKQRVLILAPVVLGGVALVKMWRSARIRTQEAGKSRSDIETMKRVSGRAL